MKKVTFDFATFRTTDDFYRQFVQAFHITMGFGRNTDALWDALTGMISLPVEINLHHSGTHENAAQFEGIINVMREAERETGGLIRLRVKEA